MVYLVSVNTTVKARNSEVYSSAVAQWLRCCVTNQKVAGLIPDDVIGIFH